MGSLTRVALRHKKRISGELSLEYRIPFLRQLSTSVLGRARLTVESALWSHVCVDGLEDPPPPAPPWLADPPWLATPPPRDGWLGRSAFALTKRTCSFSSDKTKAETKGKRKPAFCCSQVSLSTEHDIVPFGIRFPLLRYQKRKTQVTILCCGKQTHNQTGPNPRQMCAPKFDLQ